MKTKPVASGCAQQRRGLSRRDALSILMGAGGAALAGCAATGRGGGGGLKRLRIGVCTDVHKDVIHDADSRLADFIDVATREGCDFVIQLGDFCRPYDYNLGFMGIWNSFPGPRHHVIGNHEMDGGFTREQVVEYFGMPTKYYSFDANGFHFIVLDGNDKKENPTPGYARYIGPSQLEWLRADLRGAVGPTMVVSHQSLENPQGVENAAEVRGILEEANREAGWTKVFAALSGHHHIDYAKAINGIQYIQVNSMSYYWVGEKYRRTRFGEEVEKEHPWVSYTVPYRDPLYAMVTLDPKGLMEIRGTETEFIPPSPDELGLPGEPEGNRWSTRISDRKVRFQPGPGAG